MSEIEMIHLVENSSSAIFFVDLKGVIKYGNKLARSEQLTGDKKISGREIAEFVPESSREQFLTKFKHSLDSLQVSKADFLKETINGPVWYQVNIIPVVIEMELKGIELEFSDVTEHMKIEESLRLANDELSVTVSSIENTKEQLVETEKMSALGSLVAGVAHEINTPIGIGVTAASHLIKKTQEINTLFNDGTMKKSNLTKYLGSALESSDMLMVNLKKAAELIQGFKRIAVDQSSQELREYNLKQYMDEILLSMRPKIKVTKHVVELECPDDINIKGYPGALSQVMTNLIMNTLIHGFEGVESGKIVIDCSFWADYVIINYKDDGIGISKENQKKLFEPFFTTKRGSGGTGLGMHLVYNLVTTNLKGTIDCQSFEGEGTSFTIKFKDFIEE